MQLEAADYVILIVDDLDRTLDFYTKVLGLKPGHRSGDYAQLDTGATRIGFYTRPAMAAVVGFALEPAHQTAPGFELGFKVANVDAAYAEILAGGATPVTAPTTRPWGQRTAYVRDPDGHLIELAQDPPES